MDTEQDNNTYKKKKILANIKSPVIDAIINQRYVFSERSLAVEKVQKISERFVRSSIAESVDASATVIWIRGFDISEEEQQNGYVGNYAVIQPDQTPDGKWTVSARKLPIEVGKHPQRKRRKGKHPDWGYWVMRRIKKGWRYGSIDEAYHDLMQLAEDFPEVTIPSQNKVYTILYRKTYDDSLPLFRVVLEVESLPEGGFTITCKENTYKRDDSKPKPAVVSEEEGDGVTEPVGRFASMVTVQRNKRKNLADMMQEKKDAEQAEEAATTEEGTQEEE